MPCLLAARSRTLTFSLTLVLTIFVLGCLATAWQSLAQAQGAASAPPAPSPYNSQKLMLFGGPGHKTYLGCLNCNQYDTDSVFNQYGNHGSRYATDSIFNPYGDYGSRYSNYSACSSYAMDPPVIVDEGGNFYGRLTLNQYHAQATKDEELIRWLEDSVCE